MTQLPPKLVGTPYPALVPKTDADGNNLAGVRLPDVTAPTATYNGWALRVEPAGANDGCDGAGQMILFAKTKAERTANDDPRPSLEERYPTHEAYGTAVRNAANDLKPNGCCWTRTSKRMCSGRKPRTSGGRSAGRLTRSRETAHERRRV